MEATRILESHSITCHGGSLRCSWAREEACLPCRCWIANACGNVPKSNQRLMTQPEGKHGTRTLDVLILASRFRSLRFRVLYLQQLLELVVNIGERP